jgi:uncharacterized membrane protein YdbT with pleckstrin-like domain
MSGVSNDDSLAPGEAPVITVHPHWKVLARPVSVAAGVVAAALVAEVMIPWGAMAPIGPLILAGVAIVLVMWWLTVPLLRWRTTIYELTTRRLRMRSGIIARFGKDIPLSRITDVSFQVGLLDRILGSGTIVVESPGEHGQVRLTEIPRVERLQATLFQLVEDERGRITQPEWDEGD